MSQTTEIANFPVNTEITQLNYADQVIDVSFNELALPILSEESLEDVDVFKVENRIFQNFANIEVSFSQPLEGEQENLDPFIFTLSNARGVKIITVSILDVTEDIQAALLDYFFNLNEKKDGVKISNPDGNNQFEWIVKPEKLGLMLKEVERLGGSVEANEARHLDEIVGFYKYHITSNLGPETIDVLDLKQGKILQRNHALQNEKTNDETVRWIDVTNPSPETYEKLKQIYGLDTEFVKKCSTFNWNTTVRYDEEEKHLLIGQHILTNSDTSASGIALKSIYFIIGEDYIITLHKEDSDLIEKLKDQYVEGVSHPKIGIAPVFYRLSSSILSNNHLFVKELHEKAGRLLFKIKEPGKAGCKKVKEKSVEISDMSDQLETIYEGLSVVPHKIDYFLKLENSKTGLNVWKSNWSDMLESSQGMISKVQRRFSKIFKNYNEELAKFGKKSVGFVTIVLTSSSVIPNLVNSYSGITPVYRPFFIAASSALVIAMAYAYWKNIE